MPLQPGDRIGGYEILSTLGAGGMGVVYRARDVRLGRDVAIKTLPESVAADPDRLARFEREARALAALNHPNVATLYGFERADATHFLAMEVVEGATLADRIERGPIPLDQALRIFIQIAEGLEAAHAKGIIHRDLKPANIKIGAAATSGEVRQGAVKILDFGLAKALTSVAETMAAGASQSPTLTLQATMRGEILGTAAYMSPEQAQGQVADARADIWAFGVCLFEALTRERAFSGDNASLVLASVLKDEPDFGALPASTPPTVRRLLRRCLEKKRDRRLHDVADARLDLEEALTAPAYEPAPAATAGHRVRRLWIAVAAAGTLGAAIALLIAAWLRPAPEPAPLARFVIDPPRQEPGSTARSNDEAPGSVAITRDGRVVAYVTGMFPATTLRAHRLDQLEGAPLRGVEPGVTSPFFSPDDRWLGYFDSAGRTLRKISIGGGPSTTICTVSSAFLWGATWGRDDTIVFGQVNGPLRRVPAAGGEPEDLTQLAEGEISHRSPEFLPGGESLLFAAFDHRRTSAIHSVALATGERKLVVAGAMQPRYAASGHLVYSVGSTLYAVAFDPRRLETIGDPVAVVEDVRLQGAGASYYAVSSNGALVYVTGSAAGEQSVPVWVDREGREEPIKMPPRNNIAARLSPDGTRIALEVEPDIWIWDLRRETLTRLTSTPGINVGAVWSADGRTVFFASRLAEGGWEVAGRSADGAGETTVLARQLGPWVPSSVTPDGAGLVASTGTDLVTPDIGWLDIAGKAEPRILLDAEFRLLNGELSPDGRWLAYESYESGQPQIFVRPFPGLDSDRWPVSATGGTRPVWSRDGKEIFYLDGRNFLTAVAIGHRGDTLSISRPEVVIDRAYFVSASQLRPYDVSPDGRRFLMLKAAATDTDLAAGRLVLVQNWFDELRRVAPPRRSATR